MSAFKNACEAMRALKNATGGETDAHGTWGLHRHLDVATFTSRATTFTYLFHWPSLSFFRQKSKTTSKITSTRLGQVIKEDRVWLHSLFESDAVPRGLDYLQAEQGRTELFAEARASSEGRVDQEEAPTPAPTPQPQPVAQQPRRQHVALIDVQETVHKVVDRKITLDRKQLFKLVELGGGPSNLNGSVEVILEIEGEEDEFFTLFDKPGNRIVLKWREESTTSTEEDR